MRSKLLHDADGQKTYVLVFEKGDEVAAGLLDFAKARNLSAASFQAIGALSDVTLGYFQRDKMEYKKIPFREQVEVLSLIGGIATKDGTPKVHAHAVLGRSDASTIGGHLVEAHVWPTLEVVLTESPAHLRKQIDEETGLALIKI